MINRIRRVVSDTPTRWKINKAIQQFLSSLDSPCNTILDLGPGPYPASRLAPIGFQGRIISVDRDRLREPDIVSDITELPYQNNSIDGIICSAVLEHVVDPEAVLAEIHRVLKPHGLVFVWVPFIWRYHEYPADFRRWTEPGLREDLQRASFHIHTSSCAEYGGRLFMSAHYSRFMLRAPHQLNWPTVDLVLYLLKCFIINLCKSSSCRDGDPRLYTGVHAIASPEKLES